MTAAAIALSRSWVLTRVDPAFVVTPVLMNPNREQGGEHPGGHEHADAHPGDADAGPPGGLDLAADGVDRAAVAGLAQHQVDDDRDDHHEEEGHRQAEV